MLLITNLITNDLNNRLHACLEDIPFLFMLCLDDHPLYVTSSNLPTNYEGLKFTIAAKLKISAMQKEGVDLSAFIQRPYPVFDAIGGYPDGARVIPINGERGINYSIATFCQDKKLVNGLLGELIHVHQLFLQKQNIV